MVVGITGASGACLGLRILELLAEAGTVETHLVVTKAGRQTLQQELGPTGPRRAEALATVVHPVGAIGATIASGSFTTQGMIVAPCSIRTLSAISTCLSDNLLTRAADVHLKERRPLVLNDPQAMSTLLPNVPELLALGCGSMLNLPVVVRGKPLAALNLLHEAGKYSPERVTAAADLAPAAAAILLWMRE